MKKITLVGFALAAICLSRAPSAAGQSQRVTVVGTWLLVSETAHQGDKTTQPLGPNPVGRSCWMEADASCCRSRAPDSATLPPISATPERQKKTRRCSRACLPSSGRTRSARASWSSTLRQVLPQLERHRPEPLPYSLQRSNVMDQSHTRHRRGGCRSGLEARSLGEFD
jgi:hypothetical protein